MVTSINNPDFCAPSRKEPLTKSGKLGRMGYFGHNRLLFLFKKKQSVNNLSISLMRIEFCYVEPKEHLSTVQQNPCERDLYFFKMEP
jgi:hypothetical protein